MKGKKQFYAGGLEFVPFFVFTYWSDDYGFLLDDPKKYWAVVGIETAHHETKAPYHIKTASVNRKYTVIGDQGFSRAKTSGVNLITSVNPAYSQIHVREKMHRAPNFDYYVDLEVNKSSDLLRHFRVYDNQVLAQRVTIPKCKPLPIIYQLGTPSYTQDATLVNDSITIDWYAYMHSSYGLTSNERGWSDYYHVVNNMPFKVELQDSIGTKMADINAVMPSSAIYDLCQITLNYSTFGIVAGQEYTLQLRYIDPDQGDLKQDHYWFSTDFGNPDDSKITFIA